MREKILKATGLTIAIYTAMCAIAAVAYAEPPIRPTVVIKSEGKVVEVIQFQQPGGEALCQKMAGKVSGQDAEAVCVAAPDQGYTNGVTVQGVLFWTTGTPVACQQLAEMTGGTCGRISKA